MLSDTGWALAGGFPKLPAAPLTPPTASPVERAVCPRERRPFWKKSRPSVRTMGDPTPPKATFLNKLQLSRL